MPDKAQMMMSYHTVALGLIESIHENIQDTELAEKDLIFAYGTLVDGMMLVKARMQQLLSGEAKEND